MEALLRLAWLCQDDQFVLTLCTLDVAYHRWRIRNLEACGVYIGVTVVWWCAVRGSHTRRTAADRYVLNIANPREVAEICFFTLPGVAIPPHMGVSIYWAVPPCTSWDLLGVVSAAKPSVVLRTNWRCRHELLSAPHVSIGLKIERCVVLGACSMF